MELLNEAERFLLRNWSEARMLEESMEGVRTKYKEAFQRVVEAVTEAHPELDTNAMYVTQFWGKGSIGFGRKLWPTENTNWPPGFWIDHIRLETLSDEEAPPPAASIWLPSRSARKANVDLLEVRTAIFEAARTLLSKEEFDRCDKAEADREVLLAWAAPSKRELLDMISDGDGQRFVGCLAAQFDILARFVPVLDDILVKNRLGAGAVDGNR